MDPILIVHRKKILFFFGVSKEEDFVDFMDRAVREGVKVPNPMDFWEAKSWESFVAHNPKVFMAIYDTTCPNCQALRQQLANLARKLKDEKMKVKVAVIPVDMKDDGIPHLWSGDIGVPTLYWYSSGGFRAEYTGVRAVESMMQFINKEMKDPGIQWSNKESAQDVHHLDDASFDGFISENDETLVFFYSTGCKLCEEIKPSYEEAATLVEEVKPEFPLSAVNIRKAPKLKMKYEVNTFPTLLYFKNGKKKFEYHGEVNNADAFMDFVMKPRYIKKTTPISSGWFGPSSNVVLVDKESLDKFTSEVDEALVMFYAPWCGHCKKFKPEFSRAAEILAKKTSTVKLGAFDGNNNRDFNSKYDVKGFPTVVHFRNGKYISHYKGQRTAKAIINYLTKQNEETETKVNKKITKEADSIGSNRPSEVELLNPNNFDSYLEENENALVMFYAPWCGTCKSVKTAFFDAAVDIAEDLEDSSMAIFNADEHRSFADSFAIKAYPTIWYFSGGEKKYKYHGKFSKQAFIEFMTNPRQMEDVREKENKKAALWIGEKDNVQHLSRENFEDTLKKHKTAMVYFYINACQHCLNTIKPIYVEAARILAQEEPNILLAAVNGDWEKPLTAKYSVNAYPTFLYFKKGNLKYKYEGPRHTTSIVKFLKNPSKDQAERQKPKSWQDFTDMDFGRVEHLSNKTLDSFLDRYDTSVIMFHSLWHPKTCVKPREELKEAADRLPKYIGIGAVDCHRLPEQGVICYNLSVKKFPSYKYFKKGIYQKDLEVSSTDSLVEYLMSESIKKRDEL